MPKKQIIGSIVIIALLSFVCMYIYDNFKVESKTSLIVSETDNNKIEKYYTDKKNNTNYYIYGLDDITVDYTDRTLELNKALEAKQISIKEVLSFLKKQYSLNDDKVVMYQNDQLSVVECKLDNSKTNYIFSKSGINYQEGLCSNNPYVCSFTKTYYVLDISDSKSTDNIYVTLKNDITSEVATVLTSNKVAASLLENNYYMFVFASADDKIEEDIKAIFDSNEILNILVSDQTNQVNENICK